VTDVGDSAFIVADTGVVTRPSDPAALADGLRRLAGLTAAEREAIGARARARVVNEFSLHAMIQRTAVTYRDLSTRRDRRLLRPSVKA
jgi:glycosyltransferase involved in cell wall biosynthesis